MGIHADCTALNFDGSNSVSALKDPQMLVVLDLLQGPWGPRRIFDQEGPAEWKNVVRLEHGGPGVRESDGMSDLEKYMTLH